MFIGQSQITVTPIAGDAGATIRVNGISVTSGHASGAIALNPGSNTITVVVTAADGITTKTYTITAGYLAQEAYMKASNTDAGDYFGWSVSGSGDTLAVGAMGEDSSATGVNGNQADNSALQSGAVYILR